MSGRKIQVELLLKNGYIFFDDTESVLYRKTKNFTLSVNNDAINKFVYNFYCNNIDQLNYIKYFKGSGISEFKKLSEISVASGVVVDSNANHEFNENYIKAKALIDLFK